MYRTFTSLNDLNARLRSPGRRLWKLMWLRSFTFSLLPLLFNSSHLSPHSPAHQQITYSVRPPGDCPRLRFVLNAWLCARYKFPSSSSSSYYYFFIIIISSLLLQAPILYFHLSSRPRLRSPAAKRHLVHFTMIKCCR